MVEPDMYEKLYTAAKGAGADVASCNYSFFPEKVSTKEKWFKAYTGTVDWNFIERNTQPWNKICSRRLMEEMDLPYWMGYCGDGIYSVVLLRAKGIVTLNEELYRYRVGHMSMSSNYSNVNKFMENIQITTRQKEALTPGEAAGWAGSYYDYRIIYALLQAMIVSAANGRKELYLSCREKLRQMAPSKNPYTKRILDHNHGALRSFVMRALIPSNYLLASAICRAAFR